MRRLRRTMLVALFLIGVVPLTQPAMQALAQDDEPVAVEVTGVVEEGSVDSEGYLVTVKVGGYTISDYGSGADLFELLGEKVNVKGELFKQEDGSTVLDVTSYKILDE